MFNILNYLLLVQILQAANARIINAYFEGLDCQKYDKEFLEVECWLATDANGQRMMNAVVILKQDVFSLINRYSFLVTVKKKNVTYLSLDANICEGLGASFTNPVTRMVSEEAHRVSNLPYDCPLKKDVRYAINNFTINRGLIPSFTPALKWISNSEFYVEKRHVLRFNAFGRVEHKKGQTTKRT